MRIDEINSKEDFILFLKQLTNDIEKNNQDWENQDLSSYFESMQAWIEDTDDSNFEGGLWEVMSKIILAPKYYE
ncbi:DUF7660 family protein [Cytobacillus horneckiae]|uniref:DUF7660 family protein n=1 Tax=Cytobacillus horneckiae TaxID=549687 RepID=UPI003D9A3DE3